MNSSQVVLDNIRFIVRALRVSSRSAEKRCGMSAAQLFVLRALEGSAGMSVNELAARTLTHQSSVSVVVKRLVEQGFVSKRTSKKDLRICELTLSPKGEAKLAKAPPLIQEAMLFSLSSFNDSDREKLARLLSRFVEKAGFDEGSLPPLFEEDTRSKRKP
jgi:DNA-binding MarR family transcriptional regulator